jgi:hypothetical protein
MGNWSHICVLQTCYNVFKWNTFCWGYGRKPHGWWGWHPKPPNLCPLLHFRPTLSAYVNRMARRLVRNTEKCHVGGIFNTGREMGMWAMHRTYVASLEHYGSYPFLLGDWIVLYVAVMICLLLRYRSSILLWFWTNCPCRVTSTTIHSTSHNAGTFQLGVTTHWRNVSVSGRRISGGDYTAGDCIWRNESPALWNR